MSQHWPLPERFRVRLTMESDWHIGSGLGRPGHIDRLVARDEDGLPFVPAKTLRGMWRDACERLCRGLDEGQLGDWSRWVDYLFGSQPALGPNDPTGRHSDPSAVPLRSAIQIRTARMAEPLRQRLARADRRLLQALTFVKAGIQIDRRSGSAQTDFLRFEELVRRGTILEAECRLTVRPPLTSELASALLIASTKLVERIGGKRRRGSGRCRFEIVDADMHAAIAWLQATPSPPRPQSVAPTRSAIPDTKHFIDPADTWLIVPLVIHLQGPLAVSYRTTGNIVETLDFIPGFYLLPFVTQALSGLGVDVLAAVQAGNICVLPAYPEVDGERSHPVPLAWFMPKGVSDLQQRDKVVNRLLQTEPTDGTQLKQLREGYISSQPATVYKPPLIMNTHNTVEDDVQRPTQRVGGVYTYEALAPSDGTKPVVFRSELRIRTSLAQSFEQASQTIGTNWWETLNSQITLGRSKKDDYGSVELRAQAPRKWHHMPRSLESELFVWLVSDTLLRNSRLRAEPTAACLAEELSRRLGVQLHLRDSMPGCLSELIRIRRLETWHVGWGLPRPSLVALQAGSCVVFQAAEPLDPAKLAQLEASGIGERTAEGFGQVCFNHPLIISPLSKIPMPSPSANTPDSPVSPEPIPANEEAYQFARLIEQECWKQQIRRACLAIAADGAKREEHLGWVAKGEQGQPPMSQLGGLRSQLSMLRTPDDRSRILSWLDHLQHNKRRSDKWPEGSIERVRDFIESDSRIWQIVDTTDWPTLTANAKGALKRDLWAFAVRTFIDACIRAHKRDLEQWEVSHGA
jgi:CRISPR-associated protein Csx10